LARTISFEVPVDTSLFTPQQLQPRAALALAMQGFARWAKEYLVSFPRMIREFGVGLVVARLQVDYRAALGFFDAETLQFTTGFRLVNKGTFIEGVASCSGGGAPAVEFKGMMRPVLLGEAETLAARPGRLPTALQERFLPDEIISEPPAQSLRVLSRHLMEHERPLAEGRYPFVVHRHACEVADQWSFIEIPGHVGASRESLIMSQGASFAGVRPRLSSPLQSLTLELRRPYFLLDEGAVLTQAFLHEGQLLFLHRLCSGSGNENLHGIVLERY